MDCQWLKKSSLTKLKVNLKWVQPVVRRFRHQHSNDSGCTSVVVLHIVSVSIWTFTDEWYKSQICHYNKYHRYSDKGDKFITNAFVKFLIFLNIFG